MGGLSVVSFVVSVIVAAVLLAIGIALSYALGGLVFLGIALWLATLGVIVAGIVLVMRGRLVAGIGAILCAVAVLIAFFWLDQLPAPNGWMPSPLVWTLVFVVGLLLIAMGTARDTVQRAAWPVFLVRGAVGWALVDNSQDHFRTSWIPAVQGTGFFQTASGAANRPAMWIFDPMYQDFLRGTIVPNATEWVALVICGEMAFGLLIAVGLFTHVAALGAMWLHTNYMLMKGFVNHGAYVDKVFFTSELVFLVTSAGLIYGLDASLKSIVPRFIATTLMGARTEEIVVTTVTSPAPA